jgi:hypothetical protein
LIVPQAIAFGAMQFQTPMLPKDSRTVAFVGTEKILRPAGTMYALGALEVSPQGAKIGTPKGILSGSLMLSLQGRSELLRKGQRNMKLAFGFAAAFTVAGIPMGIFGPSAASGASQPASAAATATTPASAAAIPASAGANPGVRTLALGATEHGRLAATDPNAAPSTDERGDDYTVQLTAGQPVTIFTRGAVDPTSESHLDVVAALRCNGAEVARDDDGAGNLDSRIAYTPTASGPCTVRVMGFAGSGGAYSVQLLPGTVEATPEAVAVAPAVPAAAPSAPTAAAGSTCARAVRCCQAANPTDGSARATCERLALLPDTACTSTLQSYRRAVRAAHPASASACD